LPSQVNEQMRGRGIGGAIFKWWAVRWVRIRWSLTYEYWRVTREVGACKLNNLGAEKRAAQPWGLVVAKQPGG
jgi:hypothetical protein